MSDRMLGIAAALLLAGSLLAPYWQTKLFAPQYRHGLKATLYAHKLSGDIEEIDNLNHYVGVAKLGSLARIERSLAIPMVLVLGLLCLLIPLIQRPALRWLMALAIISYPVVFVLDMAFWMRYASTHLDPMAPLKLKPFSIPILGVGKVGQFRSEVGPMLGFFLAVAAVVLVMILVWRLSRSKNVSGNRPMAVAVLLALCAIGPASGMEPALQELITAATSGSTLELPAGSYSGPVVIDKSLVLRGQGQAVIDGGGQGTVVLVRAQDVTLEGLSIRNSGSSLMAEDSGIRSEAPGTTVKNCSLENVLFGIFLVKAPGAHLQNNRISGKDIEISQRGDLIRGWYSDQVVIEGNRLEAGRDAVLWFSNGSVVEGNEFRNGRYGLHFMYTNDARITGNLFQHNSVGAYLMYSQHVLVEKNRFENNRGPSGAGLGLKESDSITVQENSFQGNRQGLYIDQSPILAANVNRFQGNLFAHNDIGIAILPGAKGDLFSGNTFQDNLQQVSVKGAGALTETAWQENGRGNFWSDYTGYGAPGALTGKIPYRVESAFENIMDRQPLSRFFLFTPAAQALDLAAKAFPVFQPKARLEDPRPLLRPPWQNADLPKPANKTAMAGTLGIVSLAGITLALFRKPAAMAWTMARPVCQREASSMMVKAAGVSKSFGPRQILKDFSLNIGPGETVVLWGANGTGKSTFLKCLLGLTTFEGSISIQGYDIRREGHLARQAVGYLPQEFAGYDWTVRQAMEFVCQVRRVPFSSISSQLQACGLTGEDNKSVPALSGGMKQKLSLAQALVADPALLVLDEPCSNLDIKSRKEFLEILQNLKGEKSLILTTHRLEEVTSLADRVVWLEEGRPPKICCPEEFLREEALA